MNNGNRVYDTTVLPRVTFSDPALARVFFRLARDGRLETAAAEEVGP